MQIKLHPGAYGGGISVIGGGLAAALPSDRWIGWVFVAVGFMIIIWGIRINGKPWWSRSAKHDEAKGITAGRDAIGNHIGDNHYHQSSDPGVWPAVEFGLRQRELRALEERNRLDRDGDTKGADNDPA